MSNRLKGETSPYLQQHAENPVDWYPWGEEALHEARVQDKPILLSVGYSACHWCHVMAHESFEDAAVAALMNRHFINIKVDREERPDLDQIYQLAHQMISQRSGGWPLTMFLTPDQEPFYGGTYFPKTARYGLPGFPDLLQRLAQLYRSEKVQIARHSASIRSGLARTLPARADHAAEFSSGPIALALQNLAASYDARHGGFGVAPKFPHVTDLDLCLRTAGRSKRPGADGSVRGVVQNDPANTNAAAMALHTLRRMAAGGIYDQLGGGFCRYSVDGRWLIPHFEKMVYDNGPLLALYSDAWALTREPRFAEVAAETAAWVMREMQDPSGGYYSSLDADSEHEEGKFYVWTPDAVRSVLSADEYAVCAPHFGLDRAPNFEGAHWHLHIARELEAVAAELEKPIEECRRLLSQARIRLFAARERRIRPGRDDKILTSWNALMISGMARAARVFGRPEWLSSARAALAFIRGNLWGVHAGSERPRLLATCKDRQAHLNAYLDDYAFLLAAQIETMQVDFESGDLEFATQLADALLAHFEDTAAGGFFFTSHDHEKLIHRPKSGYDNSTPSGNGVAAFALQRLGHITGQTRYLEAAARTLQLFHPMLSQQPSGHTSLLLALQEAMQPPDLVVLRGPAESLHQWKGALDQCYLPHALTLAISGDSPGHFPLLAKAPPGAIVNAWVCRGVTCMPPVDKLDALFDLLQSPEVR